MQGVVPMTNILENDPVAMKRKKAEENMVEGKNGK